MFRGFLCIALFAGCNAWASQHKSATKLSVEVIEEGGRPSFIRGELTTATSGKETCFYLPYNNKDFRSYDNLKYRFALSESTGTQLAPDGGHTSIKTKSDVTTVLDYYQVKITHEKDAPLTLHFESRVPRYQGDNDQQWYFYEFYPVQLATCYPSNSDPINYQRSEQYGFDIDLKTPSAWDLYAPDLANYQGSHHQWSFTAPEFSFVLSKGFQVGSFTVDDLEIHLAYADQSFVKIVPTVQDAYKKLRQIFGVLPIKHLWFVDAAQYERDDLPGLVLLNRARQPSIQEFQSAWLNWSHWASVTLFSRQWFGGFIRKKTYDDEWLLRGTAEFGSLQVLEKIDPRFDFFNLQEGASSLMDLNFREMHDAGLTVLYQSDPKSILSTKDYKSAMPYRTQHAMLPLRHAAALRYLQSVLGSERIKTILASVSQDLMFQNVGPKEFYETFVKLRLPQEVPAFNQFDQWWTTSDWSDFELKDFNQSKNGQEWECTALIRQRSRLKLWTTFSAVDSDGNKSSYKINSTNDYSTVKFTSPNKIDYATIDDERNIFDVNRYNNSTENPGVKFYPGNARGIMDDGQTVIWLPYPFRRPGQAWSLALRAALFRYINNDAGLSLETEMGNKHRTAINYTHNFRIPLALTSGQFLFDQNIYGSRKIEFSLGYGPILPISQDVSVGVAARHRLITGKEKSRHATYAVSMGIKPKGQQRFLSYRLGGEFEGAPKQGHVDFDYQRRYAILDLAFYIKHLFDFNLRAFRGKLATEGVVPDEIYFRPEEINEARMRIDQRGVARTSDLYTIGNDLLLPAYIPFSDFGVFTTSRLKWRLFFDYGHDYEHDTELSGAGLGFDAPLGGDLSGVGTFAVSKISFMSVLYSKAGDQTSHNPRFLFNIGSEF